MIKLIATDIDGTLVKDGTLIIDPEYMTVISKLIDKGIIFTVCSGRQFSSEQKLFAPIKDKLMYITDGGTVVRTPDRILKTYPPRGGIRYDRFRPGAEHRIDYYLFSQQPGDGLRSGRYI